MPTPNPAFSREVLKKLEPSVIFSAHDHRGLDYVASKGASASRTSSSNVTLFTQYADNDDSQIFLTFSGDQLIHEVIVPTCSYRYLYNNLQSFSDVRVRVQKFRTLKTLRTRTQRVC
jgi:hypothetical protein